MVLSRSLAGANSGCSFRVDSYQRMAFSNSSCCQQTRTNRSPEGRERPGSTGGGSRHYRHNTVAKMENLKCSHYHCYIDVGQGEVVHNEVRGDFYSHAGDCEGILPQPSVLEDVGQTDEGHILVHNSGRIRGFYFHFSHLIQSFIQNKYNVCSFILIQLAFM